MDVRIRKSERHENENDIHVIFETDHDPEFYWTHSTSEFGSEGDEPRNPTFTVWGWIKHLRSKNWWTPELEAAFLDEHKKYFV